MKMLTWTRAISVLGVALMASSCAQDSAAEADPASGVARSGSDEDGGDTASGSADSGDSAAATDESTPSAEALAHDIYAPPLPPGRDSPPIAAYDEVPTPEEPYDHGAASAAFDQARAQGVEPDESGLILLDEPLGQVEIDGDTFTIDGVIDPGSATPLFEDERLEGLVELTPLIEELTNIPWPERREEILRDQKSETACGGADQHIWVSFDTGEDPTCFEESGGVVDPFFRTISMVCQTSEAPHARTLYMGLGGEHSFDADFGNTTGWDLMYRGPRISEETSCHAFTAPVRGAVASFGNSPR